MKSWSMFSCRVDTNLLNRFRNLVESRKDLESYQSIVESLIDRFVNTMEEENGGPFPEGSSRRGPKPKTGWDE